MHDDSNFFIYFIIGLFSLIPIWFLYYSIVSKMKGSITFHNIKFDTKVPKDGIKGYIKLLTKKNYDSKGLFLTLTGTTRVKRGDNSSTVIIYERTIKIEEAYSYKKGLIIEYDFEIEFPNDEIINNKEVIVNNKKQIRGIGGIEWNLSSNLDIKGVDINGRERIYI